MPVSRETGYPDYSYDGTNKWIPILFAGKTLEKFYASCVVANISTTDYVGEVKNVGDRVIIRTVPNITIKEYKKGKTIELEYPESPAIEFSINKAKYYAFAMDDIDIKETDLNWLEKFTDDASQQLKITFDTEVLGDIYGDVDSANTGSTAGKISGNIDLGGTAPLSLTTATIVSKLVDCGTVLDEQNIPETDRFIILPPALVGLLKKSDIKDASLTGDAKSPIRSGVVGTIDRFTVYSSNLLAKNSSSGGYHCIFGHKSALVFVAQLTKTERYRPQNTFAEAMKGLVVYDYMVIQPTALGHLYAKPST